MTKALVGISSIDGPAPLQCDGECKTLVAVFDEHYCIRHHAFPNTIAALERRELVEKIVVAEEVAQQSFWNERHGPRPKTHVRLTEQGVRAAALARLGRRFKEK